MKRKKIVTGIVAGVVVLAAAGAGVLYSTGYFGSAKAASSTTYQTVKLTTGTLEKSVTGTGTLTAGGSVTQKAPVDFEIGTVSVEAGQQVKAGDELATVDKASVQDLIETLQTDISTIDATLGQLTASQTSESYLTSSVSGRVKQILCAEGGSVSAAMGKSGGLFLLSTDGKMKLQAALTKANSTAIGDTVKVKTGGSSYTGLVEALSADGMTATVTLTDNGPDINADAVLYNTDGVKLGTGKLEVNRPYLVTAASGSVSEIYVDVDKKISNRTKLAYLVGVTLSDEYTTQVAARKDKVASLEAAQKLLQDGKITAAQDGTVQTVTMADGQSVKSGDALATLLTGGTIALNVTVDELDINNVSVGQTASVAVDAVSGKTFTGTVESISQIGTTSSGVTTYPVSLKLDPDAALKIGMNATATITVEKHENVLLLPMEALNSRQGTQFVWLYTGSLPTDTTQDPGTYTEVTTGLSNDSYVEIASGLSADDQVVVVRTKSTSSSSSNRQSGGMFGGMGDMGGGMGGPPSGGQRPGN